MLLFTLFGFAVVAATAAAGGAGAAVAAAATGSDGDYIRLHEGIFQHFFVLNIARVVQTHTALCIHIKINVPVEVFQYNNNHDIAGIVVVTIKIIKFRGMVLPMLSCCCCCCHNPA